ncbi:MAG: hypothetical protein RL885_13710 [Planctomycetota bacterium]
MEVLLVVEEARLRDLLAVGLDQVEDVSWTSCPFRSARERFRQRRFDVVILDLGAEDDEAQRIIDTFRKSPGRVEIVLITDNRPGRYLSQSGDKTKLVHFIQKPVDTKGFFYLLARLKNRLSPHPAAAR